MHTHTLSLTLPYLTHSLIQPTHTHTHTPHTHTHTHTRTQKHTHTHTPHTPSLSYQLTYCEGAHTHTFSLSLSTSTHIHTHTFIPTQTHKPTLSSHDGAAHISYHNNLCQCPFHHAHFLPPTLLELHTHTLVPCSSSRHSTSRTPPQSHSLSLFHTLDPHTHTRTPSFCPPPLPAGYVLLNAVPPQQHKATAATQRCRATCHPAPLPSSTTASHLLHSLTSQPHDYIHTLWPSLPTPKLPPLPLHTHTASFLSPYS
jgi:hypothetical protein